ncbi:MAG: hypothetical protein FJ304_11005 [Planctomycetes bacterium]|nr:hypothetical protein [Planctomycetota bacterium]
MLTGRFLPALAAALVPALLLLATDDPKPKADAKLTPEKAMAVTMVRWNKAAEGVTATGPIGKVGFTWEADKFPHPTFKGGSAEAYGAFARVLVKFLDEKGNFEFLAENNLFSAPLKYVYAGGKDAKVDWTFAKLISQLAEPKAYGDHDEATRKMLKGYADKVAERAKKDKP